jgi:tetratricopeptide (TPR) repeat protein
LKLSADHAAVLWNLSRLAEQGGDGREAERLLAALAAKSPQSEPALFRLGGLRFERGDYAGSAEAFRSCLKARADWPAAQLNLGLALWKSNNREEARQRLESVNGAFACEALRALASMATEHEEYPQALAYYKKLAESGEKTPDVYYNLGLILQNLGRPDEAAQQYRAALAAEPDMPEAVQALAQITRGPARVEEIRKGVKKEPAPGPRLLKSR